MIKDADNDSVIDNGSSMIISPFSSLSAYPRMDELSNQLLPLNELAASLNIDDLHFSQLNLSSKESDKDSSKQFSLKSGQGAWNEGESEEANEDLDEDQNEKSSSSFDSGSRLIS